MASPQSSRRRTGIGKSAALALLKDGYHVALVGRRKELLEKTAADSAPRTAPLCLPADLAKPGEHRAVFAANKIQVGASTCSQQRGMGAPAIRWKTSRSSSGRTVVNIKPDPRCSLHDRRQEADSGS